MTRAAPSRTLPIVLSIVLVAPLPARAGAPHVMEGRGGAGVLSGHETFRAGHIGSNDSLGMVTEPSTGHGYDRWFSVGTQLFARGLVDPSTVPFLPASSRLFVSGGLAQSIYTPRSVKLRTVEELAGDRPYAGWLAGMLGAEVVIPSVPWLSGGSKDGFTHAGLDLHAGLTGAGSLAGPVQHGAHEGWRVLAGQALPPMVGWGEIETAPGLTLDVSAFVETSLGAWKLDAPDWMSWSGAAAAVHWRGGARLDAGSMLSAVALSTTLAAGWMGDPVAPRASFLPLVAYVFLRTELRGVAANGSIDRPLADGRVVARATPVVAEVAAGAVVRVWALDLSWSHVYRTNETATLAPSLQSGQLLWQWSASVVW